MIVGVPKEIKNRENRVAMTPAGVRQLISHGHKVLVQKGAGLGSGIPDAAFEKAGATLVATAQDAWGAEMVVKVKEPIADEYPLLRPGLLLYTYLHLAADQRLTEMLVANKVSGVAYETVQEKDGSLPLLRPMSEVAGRMSVQIGAYYLQTSWGDAGSAGRGILLGGVPGVRPGNVVVIGGGVAGTNAAMVALGMGAQVTVLDLDVRRLEYLEHVFKGRIITLMSNSDNIEESLHNADLVIGSVLVPGAKAPKLVTRPMLKHMLPGSVIVDIAVDQGGCVETCKPTSHEKPTFVVDDVIHYCVTNMPGAVSRTSTFSLTNSTIRYAVLLADKGLEAAAKMNPAVAKGLNTYQGKVVHEQVAQAHNMGYSPLEL